MYMIVGSLQEHSLNHEWKIENFPPMLTDVYDGRYSSSVFCINYNFWCMDLLLNVGRETCSPKLYVQLRRKYCSEAECVKMSLGFVREDGEISFVTEDRTDTLKVGQPVLGPVFLALRSNLLARRDQLIPAGVLTIFCSISTKLVKDEDTLDSDETLALENCTTLRRQMRELLEEGFDSDITIRVRDCEFRAHRFILSVRSPVFNNMLAHIGDNCRIMTINDCEPSVFRQLLYFVYTGNVLSMTVDNAISLFVIADKYGISILRKQSLQFLSNNLNSDIAQDVIQLAALYEEKELLYRALNFFSEHYNMTTGSE